MNKIIAISREFGSGGREIGKRLAQSLAIAYYDREIITAIANKSGLAEKYIESISERGISMHYPIAYGRTFSLRPAINKEQMDVLVVQKKILCELAAKSDCVIVGRFADIILKEYKPLNLFIYADMSSRVKRCQGRQEASELLNEAVLEKQIIKIDQQRSLNRAVLTDLKWDDKSAYHLCINTSGLEIKSLIPTILEFQKCFFEGGQ